VCLFVCLFVVALSCFELLLGKEKKFCELVHAAFNTSGFALPQCEGLADLKTALSAITHKV
jgi:hypothetical protein